MIPEGIDLWFITRGTGTVLLVLLTMVVLLGIRATFTTRTPQTKLPAFVTQNFHRNLSLLTLLLLLGHVIASVLHKFGAINITWFNVFIPFTSTYARFWIGLGSLATLLILALIGTSLLRDRLNYRSWMLIHFAAYPAWIASVAHGLGIGTETNKDWFWFLSIFCAVMVLIAATFRFRKLEIFPG